MDLLHTIFGNNYVAAQCAIAATSVLALSILLTIVLRRIAERAGLLKPINARSIHTQPVPLLGGVAVYIAFVIGIVLFEPLTGSRYDTLSHQSVGGTGGIIFQLRGLLLGATVAVLVGVLDDVLEVRRGKGLSPGPHFLGQVLAASIALLGGLTPVRGISNPLSVLYGAQAHEHLQIVLIGGLAPVGIAFTIFWIVGMMNTINFLDGLDGLAAGVTAIAALLLAAWSGRTNGDTNFPILGSQVLLVPPLILAAALLGFLIFNWSPASIFLGDSGAQTAGFILGVLAILGPAKIGTALLILAVPILDVAWVFIRRPARGKKFFRADREHLHHRLLDIGVSQRRIVLLFYGICITLGLADLALKRISKLLAFVLVAVAIGVLLAKLTGKNPTTQDQTLDMSNSRT